MSKDRLEELLKNFKDTNNTTTYKEALELHNEINFLDKKISKNISAYNRNKIITSKSRILKQKINKMIKNQNTKEVGQFLNNYLDARTHSLTEAQYQFAPKTESKTNIPDSTQSKESPDTTKLDTPTTNPTIYKPSDPFVYILQRHPHLQKDEKAFKSFLIGHYMDKNYKQYKKNTQKTFKLLVQEAQQKKPPWLSKILENETKAIRSKHANFLKNHKHSQTKSNTSRLTSAIGKLWSKAWNRKNSSKKR